MRKVCSLTLAPPLPPFPVFSALVDDLWTSALPSVLVYRWRMLALLTVGGACCSPSPLYLELHPLRLLLRFGSMVPAREVLEIPFGHHAHFLPFSSVFVGSLTIDPTLLLFCVTLCVV